MNAEMAKDISFVFYIEKEVNAAWVLLEDQISSERLEFRFNQCDFEQITWVT